MRFENKSKKTRTTTKQKSKHKKLARAGNGNLSHPSRMRYHWTIESTEHKSHNSQAI